MATWDGACQWRVNGIGLTLLRIPAGRVMGEYESIIEMNHDFFLGDREITVGQFQQFIDDPDYPAAEKPKDWRGVDTNVSPTPDHPSQQVSWYDAVLFCNWLSHREGLTPSYVRSGGKDKDYTGTEYDAWRLDTKANGCRLPTSAEWEYACRAGTTTDFSSGDSVPLLSGYCQMQSSRSAVCGSKLPNGWGLFDVHGNVWEWCEHSVGAYRVNRGGGWNDVAANCRTADSSTFEPTARTLDGGFRLALSSPSAESPEAEQDE